MSEPYAVYLENPRRGRGGRFVKSKRRRKASRRRRRSSARRRSSRRRRRRNPAAVMLGNPTRRRRTRRSRRASGGFRRRRRARRNPFRLPGVGGGGIKRTLLAGVGLAGGELAGDLLSRVALKFGAAKVLGAAKVPTNMQAPALRIAVGLFATPILKMLRAPSAITQNFGAVNVASGLLSLTAGIRQQTFSRVGLGDYELADVLVGFDNDDDDDVELLGDYELADYELAGDFSDQDFYGGYERMQ